MIFEFGPIVLFWLLAIWATLSRGPALLYLFFGSMAFGAFAVVPPALTGGLTLVATPIVMLLIVARVLMTREGPGFFLTQAIRPGRLGLLFLFALVAVCATVFLPRLFAGEVLVIPVRGVLSEPSLLRPTAQNFSQMAYLMVSILGVFAFSRVLQSRRDRQHALAALCFGGAVMGVTGLLDFATQYLPLEPLLAPFRTATYALATNVEVFGAKRVVGLMPEASTYGGYCLAMLSALVFFRRAIADARVRNVYAPVVIAVLFVCLWLSKSSGAYVGAAVLAVVMAAEAMLRAFSAGKSRRLYRQDLLGEISAVLLLVTIGAVVVMLRPAIIDPVFDLVNRMVLQKVESDSFAERAMWRQVAFDSLWSSYGLGVGPGSTRASSALVAIFSSTGLLGGLLYYGFVLQTLLRRSTHMDWEGKFILAAFRFSFIPTFILGLATGSVDFGPMLAFGFGIVTATYLSPASQAARRAYRQPDGPRSPRAIGTIARPREPGYGWSGA